MCVCVCVCVCMLLFIYVAWCLILTIALCVPYWVSALGYFKFKICLQWAVVGGSLMVSILQCCPHPIPVATCSRYWCYSGRVS